MNFSWRDLRTLLGGVICALSLVSWTYAGTALIRVADGNDDGEQHLDDNRIDLGSSDLELGEEGGGDFQEVGIRFIDIPVGPGVNIDSSFIQFTVDELDSGATSLRIFGELTPNSAQFTATANDITNRTKTTSFVDWNSIPAWTAAGDAGADQRTPSLTPILNEIFGQATWASGNALSFIVVPNPGGERTAESFNGSSNQAPQLVFTGASVPDIVLPPPPPPPEILGIGPEGGDGFWGVREVINDGRIGSVQDAIDSLLRGTGDIFEGEFPFVNFHDEGDNEGNIPGDEQFISSPGAAADDFSLIANGIILIEEEGDYTFGFRGDDGSRLLIDGANFTGVARQGQLLDNGFEFPGTSGNTESLGHTYLTPGKYPIEVIFFERGGGAYQEVFAAKGIHTTFDANVFSLVGDEIPMVAGEAFVINGSGETYSQDFDEMGTGLRLPRGWNGVTNDGSERNAVGLGLTDGFLTVPGNDGDGVLGTLNLGGNSDSFGPAPDGFIPTWSAELGGADGNLYDQGDVVADNATDRALGVSRVNNNDTGELNFEIEIADGTLRAFVFDWDLEIWGGDPDGVFRSAEGPGMKVDLKVGGTTYYEEAQNLLPGAKFDSTEDGSNDHNATLIDGNVHSIRGMTSGIKEVSGADGAVGNFVQVNFDSNWNGATDDDANGWMSAVDNVRLRALAPGDADANGVVDVTDLLALLGGQKFNAGVDGVTWEQGDFNADDQFDTSDLLAMLSFLSGTFPSDPYASEAGGASDAVADIIVNSETGEVTVDLAGHTVSAVIIESASEIFNGEQPAWDTTSQFPSTLPGELGNVLFTSTAAGTDELGAVISAEFLGRDKEFYLQDLDLNILIASEGGALTKGNVIVVPEPSTWMLLGLGSLALVGVIRRRGVC